MSPPLIGTIGANVTVQNCEFRNLVIPDLFTFFQFTDKGSYFIQLPYVTSPIFGFFENVIMDSISTPLIPSHTLPLAVYGTHSTDFPMSYIFNNCSFTNNIGSIFFF